MVQMVQWFKGFNGSSYGSFLFFTWKKKKKQHGPSLNYPLLNFDVNFNA